MSNNRVALDRVIFDLVKFFAPRNTKTREEMFREFAETYALEHGFERFTELDLLTLYYDIQEHPNPDNSLLLDLVRETLYRIRGNKAIPSPVKLWRKSV